MKTIYLKENHILKEIKYELISELKHELEVRNIEIGNDVTIGDYVTIGNAVTIGSGVTIGSVVTIGSGAKIGSCVEIGSCVTIWSGVTIGKYAKIGSCVEIGSCVKIGKYAEIGSGAKIGSYAEIGSGAKIGKYNSFFADNIYKYSCGAWIEEKRGEIIQLGCFTRTRKKWENNFWNNDNEFPNDNSDDSNARFRAFQMCCYFLYLIKKNNERRIK